MATIYRFIIEQKTTQPRDGRRDVSNAAKNGAGKSVSLKSLLGGSKGGVEHNRKLRAINPILNRVTGGYWEKGMRLGRAGLNLFKFDPSTGAVAGLSPVAVAIILAFVAQMLMKWLEKEQQKAREQNMQNFKQLENGVGQVNGQYSVSTNFWTGKHTYNQNK